MKSAIRGEDFFRDLVTDLPEAVFVADLEGTVVYVNRCARKLLDYSSEQEMCGRSIFAFVPSRELATARENVEKRMAGVLTGPVRFELEKRDGTPVPVLLHVAVVEVDGAPWGLKAVAIDLRPQIRTENELRESEHNYRTLFEQNAYGVFYQASDGRLIDVNNRALQLFGLSRDQFLGRTSLDPAWRVVREDGSDLPGEAHPSMVALETGEAVRGARAGVYNPALDRFIWLKINATPEFRDGEETPYQVFVALSDITEQRVAEAALRESEQRYRNLFENMINGFALHEVVLDDREVPCDYIFLEVNDAFENMTGLVADRIVGRRVTEVLPGIASDPADWIGRYGRVALTGEEVRFEQWSEAIGKWFSVLAFSPSKGRFATVFEDISVRKRAEVALRQSEDKFHTLFVTSPFGICLSSLDEGCIVEVNDAFCDMTGYSREELVGNKSVAVAFWEEASDREAVIARLINASGSVEGEYVFRGKDGRRFDAVFVSRIITLNEKRFILSSFNDVTKTRMLEEQLRQSQKMESVGRLAGGVAHDFNNMLSIILGHGEMALESVPPEAPFLENLQEIQKAAERSANLTRQLLAFARKQTVVPRVLDLNDAVTGMLDMLRRLIGEDILLSWQPFSVPCFVNMDPSQIDQILANLCINARDAIRDSGHIIIKTALVSTDSDDTDGVLGMQPGAYVCLTVMDSGIGMDDETLANIFEPFFTTKAVGAGTGLGLSTIYGIVKQNGGYVNVESDAGTGTVFDIYLPRVFETTDAVAAPSEAPSSDRDRETILLVEDEASVQKMTELMLRKHGYHVLSTNGPYEALELAATYSGDIDLVITDVVMPEMNGRRLVEKLNAVRPGMKHLYISGYTSEVLAPRGVLDEGVNFIEKPYTKSQLEQKVRDVLRTSH